MEIQYEHARRIIEAGLGRAAEMGCKVSIAVVDGGRELLAFARMDDATLASIAIAQSKAYTARSLNMDTAELGPLTQPGAPLYLIETMEERPLVSFGGGLPLTLDGRIVGAVGVSGGTVEQDAEIAASAAASIP
ncbi:MAG: GlcG/HbpS family heme-binding protein [Candidatus Limnocylindria bacterium]